MIRRASADDLVQLICLLDQLFAIEEDFSADADRQKRGLKLLLESEQAVLFVAKNNDRVVGMVVGQLLVSTAEGALSLLVEDLMVDRAFRGRGFGSKLLQAVADWGHGKGADRMQLLADQYNGSALEYYAKRGWRRTKMICLRSYISDTT